MSALRLPTLAFKHKLTLITMLVSGAALLLAAIGFTTQEIFTFRASMRRDLMQMAQMLADNSSAALSFRDPVSATQTLRSLAAVPSITTAAIYDGAGAVFATYAAAGKPALAPPPAPEPPGDQFGERHLELFHHIRLDGEHIGTLYLLSDLEGMRTRLTRYLLIAGIVLITASLAAFFLARQLHQAIARPISNLCAVAGTVAAERNYAIRATRETAGEVGRLVDGFNEMLSQIQARDVQLQRAHELLEQRVEERTRQLQDEIAERRRSEEALRQSNERYEIVSRATTDVIWDWDVTTDAVSWSRNFEAVFGYSLAAIQPTSASWSTRIHAEDAPDVLPRMREFVAGTGHLWSGEYRFRRADGTYAVVFDRGYVLRDAKGAPLRMIGAMQDITERRRAEAELQAAHRELIEASRRAGQAEVATNVLHNVGNVLNSVIVATNIAIDRMRALRVQNIGMVGDLMRQNRPKLGPFFEEDPKGRVLADYLPQLAKHFEQERTDVLTELGLVVSHVEHIKEIVASQQSAAKSIGVFEVVPWAALIEQAIALNGASLERHGVALERRFEEVPPFPVDRHRIVQILVNLIRNAIEALKAGTPPEERRLVIELATTPAGMVTVRVTDNGIGIAAENLTRIFQHGFTTRRDGHGFGLHSGALTARQLGGRLFGTSEGRGHGATFVLEIPLQNVPT